MNQTIKAVQSPRPNLFSFAPSELTQDAFLCWLLAWADKGLAGEDAAIQGLGEDFVRALFRTANVELPTAPFSILVRRQYKNIDVLAEIDSTHVLVIEDKVHSADHSNQLKRYHDIIKEDFGERKHALVYLKTGDQASYKRISDGGWAVFRRQDLLELLRQGRESIKNEVFCQFLDYLQGIEDGVQSYKTLPISEWGIGPAWQGFYLELQKALGTGNWGYVANPAGGFMGFWWAWKDIDQGKIYLQLEEDELVVKVQIDEKSKRGELRNLWSDRVLKDPGFTGFTRPERFGNGKWMTIAVQENYRASTSAGMLDFDATVERLKSVEQELTRLAQSYNSP